jgi:type VI secretion system VasD/TssJ family lipoprotein
MTLIRHAACGILLASLIGAAGCGTTDKVILTTSPRLNICEGSDPHPVVVKNYYLASAERFSRADFVALWEDDIGTLAEDRLRLVEKTLNPKEQVTLPLERDDAVKGATALGIVANFCRPGEGCWRRTVAIGDDDVKIRVHLDEGCLSID